MSEVGFLLLDVPEFAPLREASQKRSDLRIEKLKNGYFSIRGESPLVIERSSTGLCEAIWFGVFTGGLEGRLEKLDEESVVIVSDHAAN